MSRYKYCLFIVMLFLAAGRLHAQGYVDQERVAPLLNGQKTPVDSMSKVTWHLYEYKDRISAIDSGCWSSFLTHIDTLPGHQQGMRRYIVELANRVTGNNFKESRQLFIPDSFPGDYKAYAPYPFVYREAALLPKLFIIDKYTQTFAAYEQGRLVRWGILSSGSTDNKTPAGRYNFNWKEEHRLSNAAPPGETWELKYVFNFQSSWGLHVHQYALPIGKAVSHGCVRVTMADAMWLYGWAHEWEYKGGKPNKNGTPVIVINKNPQYRPAHWQVVDGKIETVVELPENIFDIPPGIHAHLDDAPWLSGW